MRAMPSKTRHVNANQWALFRTYFQAPTSFGLRRCLPISCGSNPPSDRSHLVSGWREKSSRRIRFVAHVGLVLLPVFSKRRSRLRY